jgi:hypothetical protein
MRVPKDDGVAPIEDPDNYEFISNGKGALQPFHCESCGIKMLSPWFAHPGLKEILAAENSTWKQWGKEWGTKILYGGAGAGTATGGALAAGLSHLPGMFKLSKESWNALRKNPMLQAIGAAVGNQLGKKTQESLEWGQQAFNALLAKQNLSPFYEIEAAPATLALEGPGAVPLALGPPEPQRALTGSVDSQNALTGVPAVAVPLTKAQMWEVITFAQRDPADIATENQNAKLDDKTWMPILLRRIRPPVLMLWAFNMSAKVEQGALSPRPERLDVTSMKAYFEQNLDGWTKYKTERTKTTDKLIEHRYITAFSNIARGFLSGLKPLRVRLTIAADMAMTTDITILELLETAFATDMISTEERHVLAMENMGVVKPATEKGVIALRMLTVVDSVMRYIGGNKKNATVTDGESSCSLAAFRTLIRGLHIHQFTVPYFDTRHPELSDD